MRSTADPSSGKRGAKIVAQTGRDQLILRPEITVERSFLGVSLEGNPIDSNDVAFMMRQNVLMH